MAVKVNPPTPDNYPTTHVPYAMPPDASAGKPPAPKNVAVPPYVHPANRKAPEA